MRGGRKSEIGREVEWELDWTCDVVPKDGAKQEGLRYDNLKFSDVSEFVGGKTCRELRVGDEVSFPEKWSWIDKRPLSGCTISRVPAPPLS